MITEIGIGVLGVLWRYAWHYIMPFAGFVLVVVLSPILVIMFCVFAWERREKIKELLRSW